MNAQRDRVISIPLSEAEWRAFVARHPQPVDWIRQQILEQLEGGAGLPGPQNLAAADGTMRHWSTTHHG
jgi:hypothetical protein